MKKGFTVEQHQEAGELIQAAYKNVLYSMTMFSKAYGNTKEPCLSLKKACNALLQTKDKAENIFYKENPDLPDNTRSPYYGAIGNDNSKDKL